MHYVAVIDKDPGSAYGIQFPEAPGCYLAADSFDDIAPNAIEALSLFFEDGEPVPPRGIEGVREQVAGSIAEGAVLMMVPHVRDRKQVVRVNLSLENGFLDTFDEAARVRGMTHSAFVQKAATRRDSRPCPKRAQSSARAPLRRSAVEVGRDEAAEDGATGLAVETDAGVQVVAETLGVAAGDQPPDWHGG